MVVTWGLSYFAILLPNQRPTTDVLSTLPLKYSQHGETVVGTASLPHDKADTTEDVRMEGGGRGRIGVGGRRERKTAYKGGPRILLSLCLCRYHL